MLAVLLPVALVVWAVPAFGAPSWTIVVIGLLLTYTFLVFVLWAALLVLWHTRRPVE
jgi:hypothetical protein